MKAYQILTGGGAPDGPFAIYGAQAVAYGVYAALRGLRGHMPACFVVSSLAGNPSHIDGISVRALDSCGLGRGTPILVAATELAHGEIRSALLERGYGNIFMIGASQEHALMSEYFNAIGQFPLLEAAGGEAGLGEAGLDVRIYEVHGPLDKALSSPPQLKPWEAAFTATADDRAGDNISHKNHMLCELTATYWVWKNTAHDWKGICHYRRHLELGEGHISALARGAADALLPLPYMCYPNTLAQLGRFVSPGVAEVMLHSLKALRPGSYAKCLDILNGKYQYAYNLVCARREVFDDYCEWVFAALGHMERSADRRPELVATRALSYVAEALTNLYFMSNADHLAIRHVEKRIYN
jgi:hypothetical protein